VRKLLYKFVGLSLLLFFVAAAWALIEYQRFANGPVNLTQESYYFELKQGQTLKSVAKALERDQVIKDARYLLVLAHLFGQANHIQVGEYRLVAGDTPKTLLTKLNQGDTIQYSLTVVEGWTFRQLLDTLNASEKIRHEVGGLSDSQIMAKLGMPNVHPEGQFLPDTYYFASGMSDLQFLQRAHDALQAALDNAWQSRADNLPYKNAYQALIMASIVEKETGVADERPQIAGVFVRRLQKRMRLQTDPTVIYGLGDKYKGNIKKVHLKQDTPYNTYTRYGLPPTPIALAGRDAIQAAVHPAAGEDLYFVARGDGSHVFNKTLTAHNNDVIKYQVRRRVKEYSSTLKK